MDSDNKCEIALPLAKRMHTYLHRGLLIICLVHTMATLSQVLHVVLLGPVPASAAKYIGDTVAFEKASQVTKHYYLAKPAGFVLGTISIWYVVHKKLMGRLWNLINEKAVPHYQREEIDNLYGDVGGIVHGGSILQYCAAFFGQACLWWKSIFRGIIRNH